ncbi:hypothetical protein P154DRAFT_178575 [Amniculicola lignicola CBS 123094]|uniref:Uncharacterized protein n=1 Tax=Amniculicola lignicola CBS 123094 TaxID=1392246 RepID=A0A6A5WYT8_9PLEO|nr:hypothetical protein P154DRAFT_178575 [Amniculicola lignicola CBS 123094]
MDFFLPPSTFTFQSTTAYVWKPSPLSKKPRVSTYGSHNSIAKDAFWASSLAGLNDDDARAAAVEALHSSLAPKPPKALVIIERKPTPPLPIDNGPHPSGSSTMEHGQDLPTHASFERFSSSDSFAWRCDITHALGRYYMAGDKKCCPGCGSHFNGGGRKRVMDFFLPSGYVVRQIAPLHLQDWQAGRKPKTKKGLSTHNQMANLNYWNIIDEQGLDHEDACKLAIQMTDEYLDRQAKSQIKRDEEKAVTADEHHQVDDDDQEEDVDMDAANEAHQPGPLVFSLAPQDDDLDMKDIMDLSDDSGSEESDSGTLSRDPTPDTSSDDETSGSDSE